MVGGGGGDCDRGSRCGRRRVQRHPGVAQRHRPSAAPIPTRKSSAPTRRRPPCGLRSRTAGPPFVTSSGAAAISGARRWRRPSPGDRSTASCCSGTWAPSCRGDIAEGDTRYRVEAGPRAGLGIAWRAFAGDDWLPFISLGASFAVLSSTTERNELRERLTRARLPQRAGGGKAVRWGRPPTSWGAPSPAPSTGRWTDACAAPSPRTLYQIGLGPDGERRELRRVRGGLPVRRALGAFWAWATHFDGHRKPLK